MEECDGIVPMIIGSWFPSKSIIDDKLAMIIDSSAIEGLSSIELRSMKLPMIANGSLNHRKLQLSMDRYDADSTITHR